MKKQVSITTLILGKFLRKGSYSGSWYYDDNSKIYMGQDNDSLIVENLQRDRTGYSEYILKEVIDELTYILAMSEIENAQWDKVEARQKELLDFVNSGKL